jgi:hypothetical protein
MYLAGLRDIRPKGSRAVSRGPACVEILAPLRFAAGIDVAAATAQVRERLQRVHLRYRSPLPAARAA